MCRWDSVPEAVDVDAWSSSGWTVWRRSLSTSIMSIHWLNSFFSSASLCCVEIFSRARRSISCSYSFSFLFKVCGQNKKRVNTFSFSQTQLYKRDVHAGMGYITTLPRFTFFYKNLGHPKHKAPCCYVICTMHGTRLRGFDSISI